MSRSTLSRALLLFFTLLIAAPSSHAFFKRRQRSDKKTGELRLRLGVNFGWIDYGSKAQTSDRVTEFNGNQYGAFGDLDAWIVPRIGFQVEGLYRQAEIPKDQAVDFKGPPIRFSYTAVGLGVRILGSGKSDKSELNFWGGYGRLSVADVQDYWLRDFFDRVQVTTTVLKVGLQGRIRLSDVVMLEISGAYLYPLAISKPVGAKLDKGATFGHRAAISGEYFLNEGIAVGAGWAYEYMRVTYTRAGQTDVRGLRLNYSAPMIFIRASF